MSKFVRISKSKYRVAISEVLPYERPIFFSNRFFARFLKYYGVQIKDGELVATRHQQEPGLNDFLRILGGRKDVQRPSFHYSILRGKNPEKPRNLTVIHPYHQVEVIEFYDTYKMLLIDFCKRSHFSLRYPSKIAIKQEKKSGYERLITDVPPNDTTDAGIKHFFSYQKCDNINAFYDDYLYIQAEKQYAHMMKMDLKRCFESIHASDLSMAVFGQLMPDCRGSFVWKFADMQQRYLQGQSSGEGIVIGPEFSRIYAEMILQRIDVETERKMKERGHLRGEDYVFYRYVDDGFLFYSEEQLQKDWQEIYLEELGKFNMKINPKKTQIYEERPFVDSITHAKLRITQLLDETFVNRLSTFKGFQRIQDGQFDTPTSIDYRKFITSIRSIVYGEGYKEDYQEEDTEEREEKMKNKVTYKDINSFTLGLMKRRLLVLLSNFDELYRDYLEAEITYAIDERGESIKKKYEREFVEFLQDMVRVLFFLLSCDLRMVTCIKIITLIHLMQSYVRGMYHFENGLMSCRFPYIAINALDDTITKETMSFMRIKSKETSGMMEMLSVLELQKMMTPSTRIPEEALMQYLQINNVEFEEKLDFFTAFELLHFLEREPARYEHIKSSLNRWVWQKAIQLTDEKESDTESVLICVEALCNPYASQQLKQGILKCLNYDEKERERILQFVNKQKNLFIKWYNYKIDQEILQFENNDVY